MFIGNGAAPDLPGGFLPGHGLGAGWESVTLKAGIYRRHPIQLRLSSSDTAGRSEHFASISGYPNWMLEAQNLPCQGEGGSQPLNKSLASPPIGRAAALS